MHPVATEQLSEMTEKVLYVSCPLPALGRRTCRASCSGPKAHSPESRDLAARRRAIREPSCAFLAQMLLADASNFQPPTRRLDLLSHCSWPRAVLYRQLSSEAFALVVQ